MYAFCRKNKEIIMSSGFISVSFQFKFILQDKFAKK